MKCSKMQEDFYQNSPQSTALYSAREHQQMVKELEELEKFCNNAVTFSDIDRCMKMSMEIQQKYGLSLSQNYY